MEISFLLYDRMTALDVVGPHEVLARLQGTDITLVSPAGGTVTTDLGMQIAGTLRVDDVGVPDVVVVPGGPSTHSMTWDERSLLWLREVARAGWACSVCTGSLVLGAAGLLQGRRATSHWAALPLLEGFGATPVEERVCVDERVITAAGVSAGIDMALQLAALLGDETTAEVLQLVLEYDPQPPFDSGSRVKAASETVERALELLTSSMA